MPVQVVKIKLDTHVLDRMARDLDKNTDGVVRTIAHQVLAETMNNIQVKKVIDTGGYYNSIHTEPAGKNTYWVADGVDYGIYQELGTSRMAARPCFVPAVESVGRQIVDRWGPIF